MDPTERFVVARGGYVEQPPDLEYRPTATTPAQRSGSRGSRDTGATFAEIAKAVEAAKGTLLRIETGRGPGDALRYLVRDCEGERVVKRFRAHQTPLDVFRWIDEQYPQGVFMTSTVYGERWTLRFRHHTWTYDSWKRAVKRADTNTGSML